MKGTAAAAGYLLLVREVRLNLEEVVNWDCLTRSFAHGREVKKKIV